MGWLFCWEDGDEEDVLFTKGIVFTDPQVQVQRQELLDLSSAMGGRNPEGTFSSELRLTKNWDTFCCRPLNSGKFFVQYCGHFWDGSRVTESSAETGQWSEPSTQGWISQQTVKC